jgi:hypothetical protein
MFSALSFRHDPGPACGRALADDRLDAARRAFIDAVADVGVAQARELQLKARLAVSIPDLWYLRPGVFDLVAQSHSEREAWQRIAHLNRHFPTRSPRSGFGGLDPAP